MTKARKAATDQTIDEEFWRRAHAKAGRGLTQPGCAGGSGDHRSATNQQG